MHRKPLARRLLRCLAGAVGVMALVAALGTAAARTGTFGPVDLAADVSATGSNSPSATNRPRAGSDGDDGDDGSDGDDGKDGRNGRDGHRGVYVERYVTEYLNRGGDRSRVTDGGQTAIYPSGGVATGVQ